MSERTSRQAITQVTLSLFEHGAAERAVVAGMPKLRSAMHLDTVFTFADRDTVTLYPSIVDGIHAFSLRPSDRAPGIEVTDEGSRKFVDVVAESLGLAKLRVIETGGDVYQGVAQSPLVRYRRSLACSNSSLTRLGAWKMLTADQRVQRRRAPMAWRLQGTYFENCSCDLVCPCTTSGLTLPADNDRCRVVLAFHIDSGTVDDVDVSNLTVAVLADAPPLMIDGNWRVGLFMDAAASQQQADKLGAVFAGQRGGPMAMLAALTGELLGVQTAPIDYSEDGRRHRVRIGDAVDIQIEDYVPPLNPQGEASKLTGMLHPAISTLTIARAAASRVDAFGLQLDNSGKNGHAAPFCWAA